MGPPGAGKGTQGEILEKKLGVNTISTGLMLRTAIKEQTEVGKMAEQYINEFGKLAKDGNTMIIPSDIANVSGFIKSAAKVLESGK